MSPQKRLELSHCGLLHNRLDGTFLLYKNGRAIGVPMDRTDWCYTHDVLEELYEEFSHIYKRAVAEKEITRGLPLGCNRNYSVCIVLKFGGIKPGFYLRFQRYGPSAGNDQCFVVRDRKEIQLTQQDWKKIKVFLYKYIKDEPIKRFQFSL